MKKMNFEEFQAQLEFNKSNVQKTIDKIILQQENLKRIHAVYPNADYQTSQYVAVGWFLENLNEYKPFDGVHVCDMEHCADYRYHDASATFYHHIKTVLRLTITPYEKIDELIVPYAAVSIIEFRGDNELGDIAYPHLHGLTSAYLRFQNDFRMNKHWESVNEEMIKMIKQFPGIDIQKEFPEDCHPFMEACLEQMRQARVFL